MTLKRDHPYFKKFFPRIFRLEIKAPPFSKKFFPEFFWSDFCFSQLKSVSLYMSYSSKAIYYEYLKKECIETIYILNMNHGAVIWDSITDLQYLQLTHLMMTYQDAKEQLRVVKRSVTYDYTTFKFKTFTELYISLEQKLETHNGEFIHLTSVYAAPNGYSMTLLTKKSSGINLITS